MMSTAARMSRGCGLSGWTVKNCAIWCARASCGASKCLFALAVRRPLVGPGRPHRRERSVQCRQLARLARALARAMVIGAPRGEEPLLQRHALPRRVLLGTVAARHDLDRASAGGAELLQHLVAEHRLEIVAPRMRDHRRASGGED